MDKSIQSRLTMKRGFYEAGKKTQANRDFWNANSSFEATASADRDTMRARARWLNSNNPIMANIDGAIVDNVIGKGITIQSNIGKAKLDSEIERLWKAWSTDSSKCDAMKKLTFGDMQRMILSTRMVDGEVYIYLRYTDEGLQLQVMEADALDGGQDGGVVKDNLGLITGYRFKVANPDGTYSSQTIVIPSEFIINYHKAERFSQDRGITEYKQAIIDIKNFSAYQSSTISGARARASIAYTVQADVNPNGMGVGTDDNELQEINGVMVYYLRKGESISKTAPQGASDDYKAFTETTIRLMATARRVSYELAFKDYSKVNFASSRASLIQDNYRFDTEQEHFVTYVLNTIFKKWLEIEIMRGTIKIPLVKFLEDSSEFMKQRWIMPKRSWVDPLKDMLSIEKEIAMNLTTQTDEAQRQGKDFEEILQKKAKEMELLKTYGLWVEPEVKDKQSPTEEMAEIRAMMEEFREMLESAQTRES